MRICPQLPQSDDFSTLDPNWDEGSGVTLSVSSGELLAEAPDSGGTFQQCFTVPDSRSFYIQIDFAWEDSTQEGVFRFGINYSVGPEISLEPHRQPTLVGDPNDDRFNWIDGAVTAGTINESTGAGATLRIEVEHESGDNFTVRWIINGVTKHTETGAPHSELGAGDTMLVGANVAVSQPGAGGYPSPISADNFEVGTL